MKLLLYGIGRSRKRMTLYRNTEANPFATSDILTRIIGVTLIADGIVNLLIAFRLK